MLRVAVSLKIVDGVVAAGFGVLSVCELLCSEQSATVTISCARWLSLSAHYWG